MRHESHKSLIAILRDHLSAWRKAEGWSRETMVDHIVKAHSTIGGEAASSIRFDPQTRDTFERMKVNADRVFRWLDDETKDTNLLPSNFLQSVLAAMPHDRRRHCVDDLLRPLGMAVRTLSTEGSAEVCVALLSNVLREQAEAGAALAALLDGQVTREELIQAHRETSEAIVAMRAARAVVERQMAALGVQIPAKETDPS
ncbi:hypothetical protein LMG26696_03334 [Achromobacter pulmonis]|uniref:hypothetical protein n=1 Tax=Achromobacter pulmonis TaxID=1389932 RepID=UPI0014682923|nr:hypothetical protein [Achromobacter pulmonis]CAB3660290.1 hypothetical protein LMG26696_03334 [Achromobacter pulmonis]